MEVREILNIFLILGIITITVCFVAITYFIIQTLKVVQNLADHLIETTAGLKDKIGLKALAAVPPILVTLIARLIKRGR
jgi:hypothetical protein